MHPYLLCELLVNIVVQLHQAGQSNHLTISTENRGEAMNSPVGDKQWLCTFEDTCVSFDNLRSLNKHSPSRDKEIIQRY